MKRLALGLAIGIATVSLATDATASRAPTRVEQRTFDRLTGLPSGCAGVRISTASARWAAFTGARGTKRCRALQSNGVTLYNKRNGRWHRTGVAGSDLVCPIPHVPEAVQVDLKPCSAWRPEIEPAREIAVSIAQDEVDAARLRMQVESTSTAKVVSCERPAAWNVVCTLSASPDVPDGPGVICSIEVQITAENPGDAEGELVEPASCTFTDGQ